MPREESNIVKPDIEIIVRVGEREVGLFGIFRQGETEWDVVVGVDQDDTRAGIQSALQLALDAIQSVHLGPIRTLGVRPSGIHLKT